MDGSEGEGDLVLIQTFFALLWKLFLKNISLRASSPIWASEASLARTRRSLVSLAQIGELARIEKH